MAKSNAKHTIQRELIKIVYVMFACTILSMTAIGLINMLEQNVYDEIVERNETASCMYIILTRMENRFALYTQSREAAEKDEYIYQYNRLLQYGERFRALSENRKTTLSQLTEIENNAHVQYSLFEAVAEQGFSQEAMLAVEANMQALKSQVLLLVVNDLQITRDEYVMTLEKLNVLKVILICSAIVFAIGCYVVILKKIFSIKSTVETITENAVALSNSQWQVEDLPSFHYSEFDTLARVLNQMKKHTVDRFDELEKRRQLEISLGEARLSNERKDKLLIKARLEDLKKQINPHFLFNALNIIGKSTVLQKPEQALELIESMSQILRYTLEKENKHVTLQEDIDICRAYLSLQKARFSDSLSYEIDISPEAEDAIILPMLIQPIVENSIKHGRREKACIHVFISAKLVGDDILLIVEDDGAGFSVASLPDKNSTGLGLANVRQRIELEYGPSGRMEIESTLGEGTRVTFQLRNLRMEESYHEATAG